MKHEYHVIWAGEDDRLSYYVAQYLNAGWTCVGGVSICVKDNGNMWFAQAMTRLTKPAAS